MKDELQTKEYLKKLEGLKLANSTRLRMREELLAHARFHNVSAISPKATPSPLLSFLMRPAPVAFVMVLLVGSTAFYLHKDISKQVAVFDDTNQSSEMASSEPIGESTSISNGEAAENIPTVTTINPTASSQPQSDVIAMNTRSVKNAPVPISTSADTTSDEMFMSTELSAGTWSVAEHSADVAKRIEGLLTIVKKYDSKIETNFQTEFVTKLDTANKLKVDAEGKEEADARAHLDKASALIGEVEATLSTLGEVVIEDGYIVDVNF
jgi:hypothetical protein